MSKCAWGYSNDALRCKNEGQPIMCFEHLSILESLDQLEQLLEDGRIPSEEYHKQWEQLVKKSEEIGK